MNREFLREQGLNDEQIEAVMAEYGKSINTYKEKADKVDALQQQIDDYKQQIAERDKQLDNLSKQVKDNEELTAEINRLKEENEAATKELQEKLEKQAFEFALERALNKAGAKNPKAVKALLDLEKIKHVDDNLIGLDEQLTALKESDGYLFGGEEPPGLKGRKPHETGEASLPISKNPFAKEHFNLTEQGKLIRENPEQAKQLMVQAGVSPAKYGL